MLSEASGNPSISFCIVNWNTKDLVAQLIESIRATVHNTDFDIVVVDNASYDGIRELLESRYSEATLVRSTANLGYAAAVNRATEVARGKLLMILNPDVILLPGAVERMSTFLETHSRAGAVGCMCLTDTGEPGPSYGFFPRAPLFWAEALLGRLVRPLLSAKPIAAIPKQQSTPVRVEFIIGACMLVRRLVWQLVGPMDERFFAFFEETDWCYRMRQHGWGCYLVPRAEVIHLGGKSFELAPARRSQSFYRSLYWYMEKHHGVLRAKSVRVAVNLAKRRREIQSTIVSWLR